VENGLVLMALLPIRGSMNRCQITSFKGLSKLLVPGTALGSRSFTEEHVTSKVNSWVKEKEKLTEIIYSL